MRLSQVRHRIEVRADRRDCGAEVRIGARERSDCLHQVRQHRFLERAHRHRRAHEADRSVCRANVATAHADRILNKALELIDDALSALLAHLFLYAGPITEIVAEATRNLGPARGTRNVVIERLAAVELPPLAHEVQRLRALEYALFHR
jgi:hypothetical protein